MCYPISVKDNKIIDMSAGAGPNLMSTDAPVADEIERLKAETAKTKAARKGPAPGGRSGAAKPSKPTDKPGKAADRGRSRSARPSAKTGGESQAEKDLLAL